MVQKGMCTPCSLTWWFFEDRLETSDPVCLQGKCENWASAEPGREGDTLPKAAVPEHFVDVLHCVTAAFVGVIANMRGKRSSSGWGV